jgi:hypothetical protein
MSADVDSADERHTPYGVLFFLSNKRSLLCVATVAAGLFVAGCDKRAERIDMTRYVLIYPGAPVIELTGETREITVQVRNVSEVKLTGLVLEVKSEACSAAVKPKRIEALIPGERKPFTVKLTRVKDKPKQRYDLALTLRAGGLPVPAGLDMQVDTSPPMKDGWIDVGQVTLIHQEQSKTAYYLLAGVPMLLLVGWMLWRFSRPKSDKAKADQ